MTCCEVTVRGPLARAVLETVNARFDSVSTVQSTGDSMVTVDGIDQAALRALLTLLWDTGHEILRLTSDAGIARSRSPQ